MCTPASGANDQIDVMAGDEVAPAKANGHMGDTAAEITEIRVHGVSGTPPEGLLGMPSELIALVGGDDEAGFYRPRVTLPPPDRANEMYPDCEFETEHHSGGDPARLGRRWKRVVEAYSWGGLTSGPASRALWLLFLPFILINLAHWMLPPTDKGRRPAATAAVALLRLIGLSLTLTLMFAAAEAVMDLLGWQCGGLAHCGDRLGPASFLVGEDAGSRVAYSAIPVVLLVVVLWWLGRERPRTIDLSTDAEKDGEPVVKPLPAVADGEVPLARKLFWEPDASVDRLLACHVTAWTSGLGVLALITPVRYGADDLTRFVSTVGLVVTVAIFSAVVVATLCNPITGRGGRSTDRLSRPLSRLQWCSLTILVLSLVWTACARVESPMTPTHLPGLRPAIYLLLAVQVVVLAALFVALATAKKRDLGRVSGFAPSLRGYNTAVMATIACLVGAGFSVGVGLLAARLLGFPVPSTALADHMEAERADRLGKTGAPFPQLLAAANERAPLIVPPPYLFTAAAIVLLLLALVVFVGVVKWRVVPRRATALVRDPKSGRIIGLSDYPGDTGRRVMDIATFQAWASLASHIPVMLAWFTAVMVAAATGVLVCWSTVRLVTGRNPLHAWHLRVIDTFVDVSVVITSGLVAVLAFVVFQAFRDRRLRRMVGVLWDVVTFWPKANHPLTPPSYGQRTVPELAGHITRATGEADRRVIVAAHSQGTIIATAALLFAGEQQQRVGLLTFGTPLRRLYTQNFPAYFGFAALSTLLELQQHRWINMWAETDPIGSWVSENSNLQLNDAATTVDWRIRDVTAVKPNPDGTYPPICAHSGFWTRCEYQCAFSRLQKALLPNVPVITGLVLPSRDLA